MPPPHSDPVTCGVYQALRLKFPDPVSGVLILITGHAGDPYDTIAVRTPEETKF